jgi:hypothetical protein
VPRDDILQQIVSETSSMPAGLLSALTKEQILDLLAFLEAGGYKLPPELEKSRRKEGDPCGCCAEGGL